MMMSTWLILVSLVQTTSTLGLDTDDVYLADTSGSGPDNFDTCAGSLMMSNWLISVSLVQTTSTLGLDTDDVYLADTSGSGPDNFNTWARYG